MVLLLSAAIQFQITGQSPRPLPVPGCPLQTYKPLWKELLQWQRLRIPEILLLQSFPRCALLLCRLSYLYPRLPVYVFLAILLVWDDQPYRLDNILSVCRVDKVEICLYLLALLRNLALGCHNEWSLQYIVSCKNIVFCWLYRVDL